jgi:hypothetical protein
MLLNQVEYSGPTSQGLHPEQDEAVLMECGRLIHAAAISQRFLRTLLSNPIQSIEEGYCGEKFTFTQAEKQQIRQIQASTLAEFSRQLLQAVQLQYCIAAAPEMSFARLETRQ